MFGYIVVHKPELKVREYETYAPATVDSATA